jgi:hypothetical protein
MEVHMRPRTLLMATVALSALLTAPLAQAQNMPANPQTGQINPGAPHQPPSATPTPPIASHEDVRAALMMPDPGTISTGEQPDASGKAQPETNGKGITNGEQPGPIASTLQTKPAKFSHRNDAIDHTPTMAMPFKLDAKQRQQVFQAVMADKTSAPAESRNFKPADALPYSLTQDLHPLPQSLHDLPSLSGLDYMKGKDKIYLVSSATAVPIVVDIFDGK